MSQTIPDYVTMLSGKTTSGGQAITTDAVCEDPIQFASSPQMLGLKDMHVEFLVTEAFTGMDSGLTLELRLDTAASLASGSQIVLASRVALATTDLTLGKVITLKIPAHLAASTFVYFGAFYNLVSEAATAGKFITTIKQGGESVVV